MPRGGGKEKKKEEKKNEKRKENGKKKSPASEKTVRLKISMATMNAVVDPKPLFMEWLEKWRSDAARQRNNTQFM